MPPIKVAERKVTMAEGKYVILRLWKYLSRYRLLLILSLGLTVLSNVLALMGPRLSGLAVDAIEPGPGQVQFPLVFRYAGLMLLFYLISSLLTWVLSVIMIRLSQKTVYQMRRDVFEKLTRLPVGFFDTTQTGDIISRISYDVDTVNTSLSTDLLQVCTTIITVVGSLWMMVAIAPLLTLVFAVTVPCSILFTRYLMARVQPLFRKRSKALGELNGFSEEMISGLRVIKAYHREEYSAQRFAQQNGAAVDAYYNADYYGSMTGPSVNFINNLSLSLISVFGALLYLTGRISLGNLSSFVLYSRKFSGPINEMANIIAELQSACAAAERIFRLLDQPEEPADAPDAQDLQDVGGDVSVEHIRFGYTPDRVILHDLSLHARPGSLVAIVGPTGAGKTTLINLLMRFYDPQEGTIRVDGQDIRQVTRKSLRSAYTMVLQDTWLFTGTVYENLAYGSPTATMEKVVEAAKAAHIHNAILQLPQGYDTILTEDGGAISKGQKQMLTIARAMLMGSPMLILDEATSNVDTRTERQIQQAMRSLMADKTCFVIAHRLSTIQNADHILVVRDGDVVEQGTHHQLMALGGFYAQLYNAQFR